MTIKNQTAFSGALVARADRFGLDTSRILKDPQR
jgi:hypothetical protein